MEKKLVGYENVIRPFNRNRGTGYIEQEFKLARSSRDKIGREN